MSKKVLIKNKHIIIPLCVVFSVLYIIFAITRLTTELSFIPVWTVDASRASENFESAENETKNEDENKSEKEKLPFILGQTLGYFDEDAKIYSVKTFPFKATITDNSYCIYASSDLRNENMEILDENGKKIGEIENSGFPYFTDNGKFLFLPGGSSFSKLDDNGNRLWTFEGYAPITAFAASKGGIAVGTSDGTLYIFDGETGKLRQSFVPGGSEYPIIYGCDISDDGKYFACLTGLNRQRFIIAREKKDHCEIIFHKFFNTQAKRQTIVQFDEDANVVYYDYEEGLGIVNLKTLKDESLPVPGRVRYIKESKLNDFVFVLSDEKIEPSKIENTEATQSAYSQVVPSTRKFTVSVLESFDSVAGSFSFEATNSFIQVKDNMLFVGRDSEITRIDVEKI